VQQDIPWSKHSKKVISKAEFNESVSVSASASNTVSHQRLWMGEKCGSSENDDVIKIYHFPAASSSHKILL